MRGSFQDDAGLRQPLFDLLERVFPGLREGADSLVPLGASWDAISTPYVRFERGQAVSHVGVIELPLILMGRSVPVGSIHAVATHPDHRRRGHYRELIEELLADCADRYETLVLSTENPEYYEPFGFRVLREHQFSVPGRTTGAPDRLRRLDLDRKVDLDLLHRLIDTREPISQVVGVGPARAVFLFSEARRDILYSEELDVAICMETHHGRHDLYDVVGPVLPELDALRAVLPAADAGLTLHFAADRLAPGAVATARVFEQDGPSYLLARGRFDAENEPFTLPRSART